MNPVRMLVVWCPDWPVTAAGYEPDVPAAVLFANRVVACSEAARQNGVRRGLRRREAQARCPEVVVIEHDPARDARAFEPVIAAAETICPRVEIVRPGECAFATRGPSRYFGGDESLATHVASVVGHGASVGIADGHLAASLAARNGGVVAVGSSRAFLAPYPVGALDRPDLADLLLRLGIRTLGELADLPAHSMLERFGVQGEQAHRLASGLDAAVMRTRVPPPDLVVSIGLDPPVHRVDTAAFAAKSLADELHEKLGALGLACTRLQIDVETEHGESRSRLWRHDGALSASAIADRVRWQLDGWLQSVADDRPSGPISLLRLVPDEVKQANGRQLGFWGGTADSDERAARALARVQGILGHESVVTAVLGGGRGPAEQVRLVPWGDPREPARPGSPWERSLALESPGPSEPAAFTHSTRHNPRQVELPPWPGAVPSPAPATVHPEPLGAEVVDSDGHIVQVTGRGLLRSAPARMRVGAGRWSAVTAWAGPWPTDERWWDSHAHRRRARFQLVCEGDVAVLAFVEAGRWWVEATYD